MMNTYVSLDLETTGLKAETDEIIEIGCVKFRGDEVIDSFNSLVNPNRPIPFRIQGLCGISQAEVDAAPSFDAVAPCLKSFLQDSAVIGHNVSFDLGFLAQKGFKRPAASFDTHELSTMLVFQASEYSLHGLTGLLGLPAPTHRAMADAIAAHGLFLALMRRASQLDIATLDDIVRVADKAGLELAEFFREAAALKARDAFTAPAAPPETRAKKVSFPSPLTPLAQRLPVDADKLKAILGDDGPLAAAIPGYERREAQISMMEKVAGSFNDGGHLLVEAGTGTGKSMAYLLPSLFFSCQNSTPVVISTNTINLQDQLVRKDLPDLLRALGNHHLPAEPRCVQLKGRNNYMCLRRLTALAESDKLTPDEAKLLVRVKIWLKYTESGDRAELNLNNNELPVWNRICTQIEERFVETQCQFHQKGACFLFRARKAAESANIIVVNHALLLSDLFAESKILPEYKHLIVDEAHHLEEEATKQLGYEVSQWSLFEHLNRLRQEGAHQGWGGFLSRLESSIRGSHMAVARKNQLTQMAESLDGKAEKARAKIYQFMETLRGFVDRHSRSQGEYDRRLRITLEDRAQPALAVLENSWDDLNAALAAIADDMDRLYTALEALNGSKMLNYDYLLADLSNLYYRNKELRQQIDGAISHPQPGHIYWLTVGGQSNEMSICAAPLNVGDYLQKALYSAKDSVVLTSATLSTEGTFEYAKGRLGIEQPGELLLQSPFDYKKAAMLYVVRDMPNPGTPGYQQAVQKALVDLCRAARGRTLALFTSHASLRATQAAIEGPLEEDGILVLGQGVNGSARQLLNALKANPNSVVLGTSSLWEGIDVVGEALSVLVITRLPFSVPTDPVFSSRSELFDDPFNRYAIPQAALRFKQGFGRLIRSKTDRGIVAVLDSRLCTKQYASAFIDSIPACNLVKGAAKDLPAAATKWLGMT